MDISYSGQESHIRNTIITEIGTYEQQLPIGIIYTTPLVDTDAGTFWLNEASRFAEKYGMYLEIMNAREKTKAQMIIELRSIGVDTTRRKFLKPELTELCTQNKNGINVTSQNMRQVWCGKLKGMLQILFKRGFINAMLVAKPRMK